ncbi:Maf family nucleotide pyrophosphatase [Aureispira anguillae]|uniref:dTTP/UTP pyrophosphatase n=1 Tax=Aureispira anguillae TaxID=2864201 RepID=A0A915YBU6_9BACT|nr:Maf family nucleotide pyrophosphatase [Aureispira anguillae]BDS10208.1 Maf family nucleotide pyrophosphatase [Aureispira anguillae]
MQRIKPHLLLASKSPRRKQLLNELGFDFDVVLQDVVEDFPEDLPKAQVPEFLAQKKAQAVRGHLEKGKVILASDTIVLMGDTIYHKPKDYEDAVRILSELSGKVHQVITGVCLLSLEKEVVFSDVAKVHFAPISLEEIDFYVKKFQPYDKAGAYAIQEWIGLAKIQKIEGAYNSIVGLPTQKVYDALSNF